MVVLSVAEEDGVAGDGQPPSRDICAMLAPVKPSQEPRQAHRQVRSGQVRSA